MDDFKLDDVRADDPPGNDPRGNEPQINELRADDRRNNDPQSSDLPLNELRKFMVGVVPYWQTLGLELMEVEPGRAVFEAVAGPELMQNGVLHGGVLASIADSACAVAAISHVFPANYATTINLQVAYLKPVVGGRFR